VKNEQCKWNVVCTVKTFYSGDPGSAIVDLLIRNSVAVTFNAAKGNFIVYKI